ncbi:acyl-CoA carboxylase epsilon subunit [Streptomyces poriticola]|uniref:acyl-CoA carboxylase epsilon subunit n=1 Tax=Streptomyces poriticola TaxID=3120506 RepID=UPI002FCE34C3
MDTEGTAPFLRVVKGSPSDAELAAVTAVVLAAVAGAGAGADDEVDAPRPAAAGWRRPERQSGFLGPRTWRESVAGAE